ncbi:DUF924 family protein [Casimicrobium huifangae]|uniref:DUF924 family protein n=1 Tax=Casimicrobium huifangae TaxID=2591109 RepID=UPI0037851906
MNPTFASPNEVVKFWRDAGPERWFRKDVAFDTLFRERFAAEHEAAARGDLAGWQDSAEGALALLILLDQYPRNSFRNTARMFATDAQAVAIADAVIARGFDRAVGDDMRRFFYLPFMHSEQLANQERSVALYRALDGDGLRYAEIHLDAIARFGRFPHRNPVLGRAMTAEEQKYLDEGGFAG